MQRLTTRHIILAARLRASPFGGRQGQIGELLGAIFITPPSLARSARGQIRGDWFGESLNGIVPNRDPVGLASSSLIRLGLRSSTYLCPRSILNPDRPTLAVMQLKSARGISVLPSLSWKRGRMRTEPHHRTSGIARKSPLSLNVDDCNVLRRNKMQPHGLCWRCHRRASQQQPAT